MQLDPNVVLKNPEAVIELMDIFFLLFDCDFDYPIKNELFTR